jgi:hypothetical protein
MRRHAILPAILACALGGFTACGGGGPSAAEICDRILECSPGGDRAECIPLLGEYQDAFRPVSWAAFGDCLLSLDCAQLAGAGFDGCLDVAMAAAPANAADGLLEAYCERAIACGQVGTSVAECLDIYKAQGSYEIRGLGMLSDELLDCLAECSGALACDQLEQTWDQCARGCGVPWADDVPECDHGQPEEGACVCDEGWAGELCDGCAAGYVLDAWGECVAR